MSDLKLRPNARAALSLSIALGVAFAAASFAFTGGLFSILVFLLFTGLTFTSLKLIRDQSEQSNRYLPLSEKVAAAGLMAFLPAIIIFGLMQALLLLVAFAQLALNFQLFTSRQVYLSLLLSFAVLCAAAAETREAVYVIYFIPYVMAVCFCLMALSADKQALSLPIKIKAGATVLLLGFVLYLIIPKFPAALIGATSGSEHFYRDKQWEQQAKDSEQSDSGEPQSSQADELVDSSSKEEQKPTREQPNADIESDEFAYDGFSEQLDLENPDPKDQRFSNDIVLRIRSDQPMYLRSRIFDQFDGERWRTVSEQREYISIKRQGHIIEAAKDEMLLDRYEVYVEQNLTEHIPLAAIPGKIQFPASVLAVDDYGQWLVPDTLVKGTVYSAERLYQRLRGRVVNETDYLDRPEYLQLYPNFDERIRQLAQQRTQSYKDNLMKAVALEQMLRSEYQYSFQSIFSSQGVTPLSEFLFVTRLGHCEYFASALTIMLRSLGIPARLVTGFAATDINPITGYLEVRALDGHAWTEAYIDGMGWVPFEPTAYYQLPQPAENELTVEEINDYVARQIKMNEAIGDQEFSFKALLLSLWQLGELMFTWIIGMLKLLLQNYGWFLSVFVVVAVLGYWLYQRYKAWLFKKRLYWSVKRYRQRGDITDYQFYIASIKRLWELEQVSHRENMTFEQFIKTCQRVLAADQKESKLILLINTFNQGAYGHNSQPLTKCELETLKELFEKQWLAFGARESSS